MKKIIVLITCFFGFFLLPIVVVHADSISSGSGIVIDGKFDDWSGKPMTDFYEEGTNGNVTYKLSMLSDDQYLYLYVNMIPYGGHQSGLQTAGYVITIGNKKYDISFLNVPGNLSAGQTASFSAGVWDETSYTYKTNGVGYVNAYSETFPTDTSLYRKGTYTNSVAEVKIPITDFNLSTISGQSITLANSNLGYQHITIEGASTGPYIIVGIGFLLALFGFFGITYKKKNNHEKIGFH
ncbi:conserved exported protein of unknown function [Oenococcus oeni]|uniref:Firmicu-CTERM sorting domain-containing protein n=1 Tax=Oenococcus oeni TaxID=1247 RepID=UPI00107D0C06|nr:Firmicu-CTERM sorting domain-containing protein [Oenococcus oeni]AVI94627.1 hypothetical protein AX764_07305 [Oenococcus oeni]SYW00720.1 conserved exported hypothetical protein [Oenococcus oeni]SYW03622.1 conserved exported hypothetical protein [Oenococcus oeni]SYW19313.1 conserved exported hypothetical protein [Oenococcus oeni]VDC15220.1 conserved exported protein of unknown function [Oenococcus oeni]